MQRISLDFVLLALSWALITATKPTVTQAPSNETLLAGQIHGPSGHLVRNLSGLIFSVNIYYNNSIFHSSQTVLTTNTFPFNYSIVIPNHQNPNDFNVVAMIWQPAYIFDEHVKLPQHDLNLTMHAMNFLIIQGEIDHEKSGNHSLSSAHIKLELVEEKGNSSVIDAVDFRCTTTKYPCPFDYWINSDRIKPSVAYGLRATVANHVLPARKTIKEEFHNITAETKSSHPTNFHINSTTFTEIKDYKITVGDSK